MKKSRVEQGPSNDDELHQWIKNNLGMDIPRVAVCEGHRSPFDFVADIFFERTLSAVAMANRGGSKTMCSAMIHFLNSIFKPGCESFSVGAILPQADRCYQNLRRILKIHGDVPDEKDHPALIDIIKSKTTFKSGSTIEIVPGTVAAVSGPHPNKVHADEVDEMDPSVFQQSRHMSMTKDIVERDQAGNLVTRTIRAQDWLTSTRNRAHGPMDKIVTEVQQAIAKGHKPAYDLYIWCFAETAKQVPNCQVANPDLSDDEKCVCHTVVKGEWDDGSPRKFSDVCRGRLFRSRGFRILDDIHKDFLESSRDTWEAQVECEKPEVGGSVFKKFSKQRFGIKWWEPDPKYGVIVQGIDASGGRNPAAVNWYQILNQDVLWWGNGQSKEDEPVKLLKAGTRIVFDEIYKSEVGNNETIRLIQEREKFWKEQYPGWNVALRFCDPANLGLRWDLAEAGMPTKWFTHRDIKEQIKTCNALMDLDQLAVDLVKCPMWVEECEAYHYPQKKPEMEYDPEIPVDDFNHTMSNFRYVMENLKWLDSVRKSRSSGAPATDGRHKSAVKSGARRYLPINRV